MRTRTQRAAAAWMLLLASPAVRAQQESGPTAEAVTPGQAPDLVRLHDGGLVRGTISELRPGSHVVIVDLTGKVQRFEASELAYAGPAADEPASGPAAAAESAKPEERSLRLILQGAEPGTTFWIRTGTATGELSGPFIHGGLYGPLTIDSFNKLCTAPCKGDAKAGTYTFGLSDADGRVTAATPSIRLDADTTLRGEFTNNSTLRGVGWALLVLGPLAAGATMVGVFANRDDDPTTKTNKTPVYIALAGGAVAMVAGIAMAWTDDSAEVEIVTAR